MPMRRLEHLRGISDEEATALRVVGVNNTNQLIHRTTLVGDREHLSGRSGLSTERLLALGGQARLMEISGLGPHLRALLRLGVVDIRDLRQEDPADLHRRLIEITGHHAAPSVSDVQYWVSQARYQDTVELPEDSAADRRRRWVPS